MATWSGYRHVRPVLEAARLDAGTLARFASALTWPEILRLDRRVRVSWWTYAIGDAEDRGLLRWLRDRRAWVLTDAGREAVRGVA
jgi:hypothetical protein